ncbi:MAG: T9SS type A sorting domain-containing protein [Bacteroidetes bacterium]|nr:T9SS type A sorting domain-containing protein [Bacteroidota bacterium]
MEASAHGTYIGEFNNQDIIFLSDTYLNVYRDDNTANMYSYSLPSKLMDMSKYGQDFFISTQNNGVYLCSSSYQLTPINNGLTPLNSNSTAAAGGYLFSASNSGIYKTSLNTINWVRIFEEQTQAPFNKIISFNNFLFACSNSRIYKSSDLGNSWVQIYTQQSGRLVNSIWSNSEYIFASIGNSGLIKRSLAEVIGITTSSSAVSNYFSLHQNYPNPFNPNTVISFQLPINSSVSLRVYDINGREVSELVNEKLSAGEYKIDFNGASLPSGVYYYKMTTENFSETKKMILVK